MLSGDGPIEPYKPQRCARLTGVTNADGANRGSAPFSRHDLDTVTALVGATWRDGLDRDWSAPAGTLDWTCAKTADHTVDAVAAVAFFLASRRQDDYPTWGLGEMGEGARPRTLIEAVEAAGRILSGIVAVTPPDIRAVIWRRPRIETRGPEDFAPRGALEMVLHGHDVALGLGVAFEPPPDVCARLRDHTRGWPHWSAPGWSEPPTTDDPWSDLLRGSGRARADRST